MLKKRIIPVILLRNGYLVQSKGFKRYKNLGNPVTAVKRLSEWGADELIYIDISNSNDSVQHRIDHGYKSKNNILDILEDVSQVTSMPSTIGGKIKTLQDIEDRLRFGADKVSLNSMLYHTPKLVQQAVKIFGRQCIVASIDVKAEHDNYYPYTDNAKLKINAPLSEWIIKVEDLGVGEILLNSIDQDGGLEGYDLQLIEHATQSVHTPLIVCGGAGQWSHFADALNFTKVSAVAAANIFHYKDQSVYLAKQYLHNNGYQIRKPKLNN